MDIQIPSLIILNGSQGMGKSHCIQYIMYQLRKKLSYGVVFCNTFFDDDPFPYVDQKFIHPQYDEKILENLMNIQEKCVKKGKVKEAFVIFDDCLDDPNEFTSPALKRLSTQLRHYHITVIFSTQYCNLLPTRMRANAMIVIIFQTDTKNSLEALYNSYGQKFETLNDFRKYVMKNLGKYKFIYFNKENQEKKLDKVYQVMMAPQKIPEFKISL